MAGEWAGKGEVRMSGSLFFLRFFQALDLAFDHQLFIAAELQAKLFRKALRAFGDKVDMRAFIEHQPRGLNGIADALYAANAAGAQGGAVHHQGIELHAAIAGEKAAAAGIKGFVVFMAVIAASMASMAVPPRSNNRQP